MVEITDCEIVGTRVRVINNAGKCTRPCPQQNRNRVDCRLCERQVESAICVEVAKGRRRRSRSRSIADRGLEGAVPIACQGREAT